MGVVDEVILSTIKHDFFSEVYSTFRPYVSGATGVRGWGGGGEVSPDVCDLLAHVSFSFNYPSHLSVPPGPTGDTERYLILSLSSSSINDTRKDNVRTRNPL